MLEHIPKKLTHGVLTSIGKYVKDQLIMSWSNDREGIGHVNCKAEEEWHPIVEKYGFKVNQELTKLLKEAALVGYISHSVTVFDKVDHLAHLSVDRQLIDKLNYGPLERRKAEYYERKRLAQAAAQQQEQGMVAGGMRAEL